MKKSYQQRQPLLKQRAKSKQPCLDAEFEDHSLKQTNQPTHKERQVETIWFCLLNPAGDFQRGGSSVCWLYKTDAKMLSIHSVTPGF